jgi:hypothetical protein
MERPKGKKTTLGTYRWVGDNIKMDFKIYKIVAVE